MLTSLKEQKYLRFIPNKPLLKWMWNTAIFHNAKCLNSQVDPPSPVVLTQHTLGTVSTTTATVTHPFTMIMNANNGVGVGTKGEIMFRLFRVSGSIFLGLTDRPINLIYCVSPHPLTSSTGLLSNELLRLGTIGVLVPVVLVLQLLRWQDSGSCTLALPEQECPWCCSCCFFFMIGMPHVQLLGLQLVHHSAIFICSIVKWFRFTGSTLILI